jgi:hypothetical protein
MLAANPPPKFPKIWGQNAGAPFIRPIPVESQIGIDPGFASLNDGFPPLTMTPIAAGGVPPFGQDMNGILNQITQVQQWQQAGGGWQFDANFMQIIGGYPQGAILNSKVVLGRQWVSTVDNNMTDPDSASAANWATVSGQIPVGTPVPSFSPIVPPGYVAANGLKLGNVASGADNASPSNLLLFRFVWRTFSNAQCPLFNSAGQAIQRGANPDADWNANNKIVLPDGRCAGLVGADAMGNGATGLLNGVPVVVGNATTPGSILGENLHSLIAGEIPSITSNGVNSIAVNSSAAFIQGNPIVVGQPGTGSPTGYLASPSQAGVSSSGSNQIGVTSNNTGGSAHNTVSRNMIVYWNLAL